LDTPRGTTACTTTSARLPFWAAPVPAAYVDRCCSFSAGSWADSRRGTLTGLPGGSKQRLHPPSGPAGNPPVESDHHHWRHGDPDLHVFVSRCVISTATGLLHRVSCARHVGTRIKCVNKPPAARSLGIPGHGPRRAAHGTSHHPKQPLPTRGQETLRLCPTRPCVRGGGSIHPVYTFHTGLDSDPRCIGSHTGCSIRMACWKDRHEVPAHTHTAALRTDGLTDHQRPTKPTPAAICFTNPLPQHRKIAGSRLAVVSTRNKAAHSGVLQIRRSRPFAWRRKFWAGPFRPGPHCLTFFWRCPLPKLERVRPRRPTDSHFNGIGGGTSLCICDSQGWRWRCFSFLAGLQLLAESIGGYDLGVMSLMNFGGKMGYDDLSLVGIWAGRANFGM